MIRFEHLLNESRIACQQTLPNKKCVLERVSELLSQDLPDLEAQELLMAFINRERLGSTDLGHGIALPHIRSIGINQPRAAFIQLNQAVEFDPIKHTEVDLVFALLVPDGAPEIHLTLLGQLASALHRSECRQRLRLANSPQQVLAALETAHA